MQKRADLQNAHCRKIHHLLFATLLGRGLFASLLGHGSSPLSQFGIFLAGFLGHFGSQSQLSLPLLDSGVRVQLKHGPDVLQRVSLDDGLMNLTVGGPEDLSDLLRLEKLRQVSNGHLGHGQVPTLLNIGRLAPGAEDGVELLESGLGPDAEPANVSTGGQLEQVQVVDANGVDSRDVPERLGQTLEQIIALKQNAQG